MGPVMKPHTPVPGPPNFLNLPRELRDLIYSYLLDLEGVYTQIRVDAHSRNLILDQIDGGQTRPSSQLNVMQASRSLWEEASRIFYGENRFHFHVGSTNFNTTLLTRRNTSMMQDIEISLYHRQNSEEIRVLQLFRTSEIIRKSCLIKLQFRMVEFMNKNTIKALAQMTGFTTLIFELKVPDAVMCRVPGFAGLRAPIPWLSALLTYIKASLTTALGPSTFSNDRYYRRLIFKPQDHIAKETEKLWRGKTRARVR